MTARLLLNFETAVALIFTSVKYMFHLYHAPKVTLNITDQSIVFTIQSFKCGFM